MLSLYWKKTFCWHHARINLLKEIIYISWMCWYENNGPWSDSVSGVIYILHVSVLSLWFHYILYNRYSQNWHVVQQLWLSSNFFFYFFLFVFRFYIHFFYFRFSFRSMLSIVYSLLKSFVVLCCVQPRQTWYPYLADVWLMQCPRLLCEVLVCWIFMLDFALRNDFIWFAWINENNIGKVFKKNLAKTTSLNEWFMCMLLNYGMT